MIGSRQRETAQGRPRTTTTIDELVRHLQEAGAKRVYLSKAEAFQDDVIPLIATVECQRNGDKERGDAESETLTGIIDHYSEGRRNEGDENSERKRVARVFETLGDSVWFASKAWIVDWTVRPAYSNPPVDLTTLYDRGIEYKHRDGFNLRNVLFAYEQHCETDSSPSEHRAAMGPIDSRETYW